MLEENIAINPKAAPVFLRVLEPTIEEGIWPCSEDLLGRHKEIENISPVLLNAQAPLVFAIDAPWGGGKTTFIKLWQQYFNTQGQVSLYLNCWENDFVDDPLLPMLSVFDDWLSTSDNNSEPNKAWEVAKKLTPGILKSTAVAAAKIATFGGLDLEKEYEKVIADMAGGTVDSLVDSFNVKKKVLTEFKTQITKAMEALPDEQQNLIIFIDELDRCRPTYAIEVLERMKHLFDIERVVFVLAVNREQLVNSLQGVYGSSFDGKHYLKRFVDLDYQLRTPDQRAYLKTRLGQDDIKNYFSLRKEGGVELDNMQMLLNELVHRFDYQLRDIDQLIMRLRLILRSIPKEHFLDVAVLVALLVLRNQNPKLYEKYVTDAQFATEVILYLMGKPTSINDLPQCYGWVGGWLIRIARDEYGDTDLNAGIAYWENLLGDLNPKSENHSQVERLINLASDHDGLWNRGNVRELAFNRIELVNQIDVECS